MDFRRLLPLAIACLQPLLALDAEAGPRSRPIRTGQTTCYDAADPAGAVVPCAGTGQDGELKRGERRNYVDNGDGTIRDKRAGLTWEKLSDDGSIHDRDNTYTWQQTFEKIDELNEASFAGFDDWRVPNSFELMTLLDLGTFNPAISAAFRTGCTPGCTVLTCSCAPASLADQWTSTTYAEVTSQALAIRFLNGTIFQNDKTGTMSVRAVRGGTVPGGGM